MLETRKKAAALFGGGFGHDLDALQEPVRKGEYSFVQVLHTTVILNRSLDWELCKIEI